MACGWEGQPDAGLLVGALNIEARLSAMPCADNVAVILIYSLQSGCEWSGEGSVAWLGCPDERPICRASCVAAGAAPAMHCCQSLDAAVLFTSHADTNLLVGWEDSYGAAEI